MSYTINSTKGPSITLTQEQADALLLYLNNVETYLTDDLRVEFIDEMLKTQKNFDTHADAAISLLKTLF